MITLSYEKEIKATPQKIWDVLWNEETYPMWTKVFSPGSQMTSDWKVGGKTTFTDGKGRGMFSTILAINRPYEIVFEHLGELKGDEEDSFEKDNLFDGAQEKYFLTEHDGTTILKVDVDTLPEYREMMDNGFEKGLEIIKQLAEQ